MLNVIRHLLPRGRAWLITLDKPMRKFFAGLGQTFDDIRTHLQLALLDVWPNGTRALDEWERQFGLPTVNISEEDRRTRLAAAWAPAVGQGLDTVQAALQAAGFNVYVHNWWVPGTEPAPGTQGAPTARDPGILLSNAQARQARVDAGEALAEAGEPLALAGNSLIDPPPPLGFILVNIIQTDAGRVEYDVPTDPAHFPHVIYIGAETFGEYADVPRERQEEFEALCLRLRPAHKWIGMLVNYT
ncbi:hypothetical protein [Vibrio phage CKB-S1]|nr:hypothetical protein [Vibrio phage CKB-S1]